MKMKVTVTFEYEANPKNYPYRQPAAMARMDQESYSDPLNLAEALMGVGYEITVEPAFADDEGVKRV